jgi:hypothetical protein
MRSRAFVLAASAATLLATRCRSGSGDHGTHGLAAVASGSSAPAASAPPVADAARGAAVWSRGLVATGGEVKVLAAAGARRGALVVAGSFSGAMDLGGGPLRSEGVRSGFVAKLDAAGRHLWSKRFAGEGLQLVSSVAVDEADNVVATGVFDRAADFGGGPLENAGLTDVFVAKFDPEGRHVWSKRFGDGAEQEAGGVAIGPGGSVILVGSFEGAIDFGGGRLRSAGSDDVFVAVLDADGKHRWSKGFGDRNDQHGRAVAVDAAGNIVLAGDAIGSIDLGAGPLTSPDAWSLFLARFDPRGKLLAGKLFEAEKRSVVRPYAVALDRTGAALVAGALRGAVDFGGGQLRSAGDSTPDAFAVKLDAAGAHVWSHRFGDAAAQEALAVAVDTGGSVVLAGRFEGSVDFGGGFLRSAGLDDVFVARFDPTGQHRASARFGDPDRQEATCVVVDSAGSATLAGNSTGTVDFGAGAIAGPAGFAVKLADW